MQDSVKSRNQGLKRAGAQARKTQEGAQGHKISPRKVREAGRGAEERSRQYGHKYRKVTVR